MNKIRNILIAVFSALLLFSCATEPPVAEYWPTEDWRTSTPEEQGVSSEKLAVALETLLTCPNVNFHSFILIRNGYIIAEYYAPGYDENTLNNLHSATKSFTGTLVGIAETRGLLNTDDTVLSYFPDREIENVNRWKEQLTIDDLLTMRSGMEWSEQIKSGNPLELSILDPLYIKNSIDYLINQPISRSPGNQFHYNTGSSHLLMGILNEICEVNVSSFIEKELFALLGITEYYWAKDNQGLPIGGYGLHLSSRDMAKLGYLYLNRGQWEGRQIISEEYIENATKMRSRDSQSGRHYGRQIWTESKWFYAIGYGGQYIFSNKNANYTIVITADTELFDNAFTVTFWKQLFAAFISKDEIEPSADGREKLNNLLQELSTNEKIHQETPQAFLDIIGQEFFLSKPQFDSEELEQYVQISLYSITIDEIRDSEMVITVKYNLPDTQEPQASTYLIGLDNRYRMTPCSEHYFTYYLNYQLCNQHYPEPERYHYAMKASFDQDDTLHLESYIIGSAYQATWDLRLRNERLELDIIQPNMYVHLNGSSTP